jgi:CPA2 family monovalent cation:H+ antiporter-2
MPTGATPLLATVVICLAYAYACGLVARLARLPPLVGYLLAGVVVGPFTPGFVADQHLSAELAEIVVEQDRGLAERLRRQPLPVVYGDATRLEVLKAAHPETARVLLVAVPERFMARRIIELARELNPRIDTVVRTHTDEEEEWLTEQAVGLVVMSERETALGMAEYALREFGQPADAVQSTIDALRQVRPT